MFVNFWLVNDWKNVIGQERRMRPLRHYIERAVQLAETPLASLMFLASLRNSDSGHYVHEGWGRLASAEEIHSVMRETHQAMFQAVLRLSLIDLSKQLRIHFQLLNQRERETSVWWLEIEPFRDLIPQGCSVVLRELFVSNVRTALEILCCAPDWSAVAVPTAWPLSQLDQSLLLRRIN